ncbi:MAG TPA: murein biosynthesis integral membrane protein MurJ [Dissulfurispiraceae bacterium]|nr:murein biosynthesis integral membrane protein MurJ [Dissulfurispiraceae bacterium]
MSAQGRIARAAGVMSAATFISRILGYIKDMILAGYFGASAKSDVFFVAFRIPNLLRELFAEGSMSAAFVPVLTETQTKEGRASANRLVRAVLAVVLLVVGSVCILGIIFAPVIVTLIAPGFVHEPVKFADAVLLTRIMFPFLLFISLASLAMGALNTRGVFFIPALAPALLNVVTIVCIVALASQFANPVIAVAIGITLGGLVQFLFQVPAFWRQGFTFFRRAGEKSLTLGQVFAHPGLRRMSTLIIPATFGMAVAQINIFVSTILASYLSDGSITYLYYSMRLIQFPIGIFGVAMGMAILPALSEHAAKKEFGLLREDFSFALRLLFFITVPAMAGLIALQMPIVNTLFQRGEFTQAASVNTAQALMYYAVGIWAIVGVRTITSTFYAMQDTKTPVKIASCGVIINIIASVALMGPMQHNGLALANSIAAAANFMLLFYFLREKLGNIGTKRIVRSFAKTGAAAVVMGGAGWFATQGELWTNSGQAGLKAIFLSGAICGSIGLYLAVAFVLKSEELLYLTRKIHERFQGR